MSARETFRGVVYPWQIDQMGHMNVQFYTARFDEATWHFFAALGITPDYLREQRRAMMAVDQHTQYRKEVLAGALIVITSELVKLGRSSVRFRHSMRDAISGEEVATTELVGVHVDAATRKPVPVPEDFIRRATQEPGAA